MNITPSIKKIALITLVLLLTTLTISYPITTEVNATSRPSPISPDLALILANSSPSQFHSVIVYMADELDTRTISGRDKGEKQKNIIQNLHQKSDGTQALVRQVLQNRRNQKQVQSYTPMWFRNAIAVSATTSVINEIAKYPEVGSIVIDATIQMLSTANAQATTTTPVEANVSLINAPGLWNLGFKGQGVVVASLDTGVDYTHPDLNAQWRGGTNSWYDPYGQHPTIPTDLNGHGTWTMGVMVGGSAGGTAIGVAPQAKWIAAKIFNDAGTATASAIHLAFQWALDPDGNPATPDAPDVINNSWSSGIGCSLEFAPDLQNLVNAGITPVFAAGNYGPATSSSSSPANNPNAFSVGSINSTNLIDSTSSRGPSTCGGPTVTFPSLVAPGVNILSSDLYSGYMYSSGTSLAAPHVTGALALLLSSNLNLTVAQQENALLSSAHDLGTIGVDNAYGAGRLDVLAAYNQLNGIVTAPTPTPTSTSTPIPAPTSTPIPAPTSTSTPIPTSTSTPTANLNIFSDGFETGNFSAWKGGSTGGVSVSTAAAMVGIYGMQAKISGNTPGYVTDNSPNNEIGYNASFSFNPNSTTTGTSQQDILVGLDSSGTTLFKVQYRRTSSGTYQVRGQVTRSGGTSSTNWYTITNSKHTIGIGWKAGSSTTFSLYVDAILQQTLSGLNTSGYLLKTVRLGPSGGLASGMSGTEYFDAFVSTRN